MGREDVKVKPGYEFDHYFPKAKLITIVKKKGARVEDTLQLIPAIIRETAFHTRRFAREYIRSGTLLETCRKLWEFVYNHIAYKKDEEGKEQVRSPARTWHDRHNKDPDGKPMGVDCDCMTVFVVSVLYNVGVRNIFFRVTKYKEKHFEHIYPIVLLPDGEQITIDCVVHSFNYEEPYSEKKDTPMDLEYLNGVTDSAMSKFTDSPDLMGIMDEHEALSALGRIFERRASSGDGVGASPKKKLFNFKKKSPEEKNKKAEKRAKTKKFLGKGLHVANRINPVTVALRNGVLAGMKLNFLKIGSNLRWTYLSDQEAEKRGFLMDRYRKLKTVREKLEKIFYGAGGKPENLKKAILTGRGNRDKAVPLNGLGYIPDGNVDGLNEDMPLNQLLGQEIYHSENVEGMEGIQGLEGFGELGDLGSAAAASIAAASTALTAIAALIKNIGSIFPKKQAAGDTAPAAKGKSRRPVKTNQQADSAGTDAAQDAGTTAPQESGGAGSNTGEASGGEVPASQGGGGTESGGIDNTGSGGENTGDDAEQTKDDEGSTDEPTNGSSVEENGKPSPAIMAKAKSFWENNKKWIKPTGYIAGTLGLIALAYYLVKKKDKKKLSLNGLKKKSSIHPGKNVLSGIRSKKKGGSKPQKKPVHKKKSISLL